MKSSLEHLSRLLVSNPCTDPVITLMAVRDPDPPHAIQVGILSASLYDQLAILHKMQSNTRQLLIYAALLHDIGWSTPDSPHHKASMQLILDDLTIPFSPEERSIVALIARYHRKAVPSPDHIPFGLLSSLHQDLIRWNAAILRVADALDRPHQSLVGQIIIDILIHQITIHCFTSGEEYCSSLMDSPLEKKSGLLRDVTNREILFKWN